MRPACLPDQSRGIQSRWVSATLFQPTFIFYTEQKKVYFCSHTKWLTCYLIIYQSANWLGLTTNPSHWLSSGAVTLKTIWQAFRPTRRRPGLQVEPRGYRQWWGQPLWGPYPVLIMLDLASREWQLQQGESQPLVNMCCNSIKIVLDQKWGHLKRTWKWDLLEIMVGLWDLLAPRSSPERML